MTLLDAKFGVEYTVTSLNTHDEELEDFLFTLGCYVGEKIVVVSKISGSYVISVKDGRYNIDPDLAECISISE